MADEENYVDSDAEESEEDRSTGDSDSSEEEEEEEEETQAPNKDIENFINDESDEGEGVVEGGREEAIAEGEDMRQGEEEDEEEVESEDGIDAKRRKRGREL